MIHAITLQDFLAHKHTVVRLGPGMNVLTGPNNCGKSAVVEALRCVASNPTPRHFIRHGAKEARVSVEVDGGAVITWVRKPKTVIYELLRPGVEEPEVFRKLRKGQVPEEVSELLRLDAVELESGKVSERSVDVHIGNQRKPIFLLDDDGADARMADFFAASSESAHLLAMQKLLKNRVREAKMEEKGVLRSMRGHEQELDRLTPLPGLELQLERAATTEAALEKSRRELPALQDVIARQAALAETRERKLVRCQELERLTAPPELYDTPSLARTTVELVRTRLAHERTVNRSTALADLSEPPQVHDTASLARHVAELERLAMRARTLSVRGRVLDALREPPQTGDLDPLAGLLEDMRSTDDGLKRAQAADQAAAERLASGERALRELMERMGNCPLCGAAMDPDAMLHKEGA